jgi:hypothetical protein
VPTVAAATVMMAISLLLPDVATQAAAQPATDGPMPSLGFVGAGLSLGPEDGANRIRFPAGETRPLWHLAGSVRVGRHVGLGAELASLGTVTGGTRGISFELSERQEEHVLLGVLRVRPSVRGRVAVDLLGGAGVLLQHRETTFRSCGFSGGAPICAEQPDVERRQSLVLAAGLDVPMALTRHLAVAPIVRVLALRRGELETSTALRRSSIRLLMGASMLVGW